jgi:predicted glycoside hydrolase/deacetylase ChbG (UPF0249 family)
MSSAPPYRPQKKLVIHADDFGLTESITRAIIRSMQEGVVRSTSLLANLPCSPAALEEAKGHRLDVGWHVNFTLGKPLSPAREVTSLVDARGNFYPLPCLLRRSFQRKLRGAEILRELQAQWEVFRAAGVLPTHLDGHQHVHLFPQLREAVREIVLQHAIPFVRLPQEGGIRSPRFLTRTFLRSLKGAKKSFWTFGSLHTLPFYGLSLGRQAGELAAWARLLQKIRQDLAEIMVHPGLLAPGEATYGDDFPGDREKEWQLLMGSDLKNLLQEMNFTVLSFRDLLAQKS